MQYKEIHKQVTPTQGCAVPVQGNSQAGDSHKDVLRVVIVCCGCKMNWACSSLSGCMPYAISLKDYIVKVMHCR